MSIDSFGMAMASVPTTTPPTSLDAPLAKKSGSSSDTSTTSTSAGTDPLMDALRQTLAQLGYSMPSATLSGSTTFNTDSSDSSASSTVSSTSSSAATTGAQFLAALYQALALQQSISARNGETSSVDRSGNTISGVGDTSSVDSTSAYLDLASRIANLSDAASSADDTPDADSEWDYGFDDLDDVSDASDASDADASDEADSLDSALSNLNDALQAHVSALDADPDATVTLSDVLDGLSNNASSLNWQPVGVLVDVAI